MIDFCTLFDSNYIDRGLALYNSLEKVCKDFRLYIFCFDDKSLQILEKLELRCAIIISEKEILDETLLEIKRSRRRAEYLWTCTPIIIKYVLDKYHVKDCTYVDADMVFYADPGEMIDLMRESGAAASLIGHRFPKNIALKKREKLYGRYCVEFNTFCNNEEGKKILSWWRSKCIESCTMDLYKESYGDQKYLEQWKGRFGNIYETIDLGAGVAPWNVGDYRLVDSDADHIYLKYRNREECKLIFYHFQSLKILSEREAFIEVYNELGRMDNRLINILYSNYIRDLIKIRKKIKEEFAFEIPVQENRSGETKSQLRGLQDWIVYIWQSLIIMSRGHKNFVHISANRGE